jgi:integrase
MAVRKRGQTWEFTFDAGRNLQGKRKQVRRSGFRTKREAEQAERQARNENDQGFELTPERLTTAQFLERWLNDHARRQVAPATFTRYSELINLHVIPVIGGIPLKSLRKLHVEGCYTALRAKGRSERTALHVHRVLKQALGSAVGDYINRNPCDQLEPPHPGRAVTRTPTLEELLRILDLADATQYGQIFRLAALTGLRQGELLALRWANVGRDVLHVVESARRRSGQGVVIGPTKTNSSRRAVALDRQAVELLQIQRRRQAEQKMAERLDYEDHDLVFAGTLGRPIDGSLLSYACRHLAARAGAPGVRFHDIRHAHASIGLSAGVPLKVMSERLGHSTIATTADLYSHVAPNLQAEAAAAVGRLLEQGVSNP